MSDLLKLAILGGSLLVFIVPLFVVGMLGHRRDDEYEGSDTYEDF